MNVNRMVFSFHRDIDRHKDGVKFPIAGLHQYIQDRIYKYANEHSLVMIDSNIWVHMNEYFIFFYMKGANGRGCRIDCEIIYDRT